MHNKTDLPMLAVKRPLLIGVLNLLIVIAGIAALMGVEVRERPPLDQISGLSEKLSDAEEKLRGRGRLLVRYSGTEPLLRIYAEGESPEEVKALLGEARALASV